MAADVLVLCYHALSPTWKAGLSTTPGRFERQISLLIARGYRCVTFTEAVTSPPPGRVLAVTFDDAFRSVMKLGLPILGRLGVPATVFVPTDFPATDAPLRWSGIDGWLNGPDERELTPMSWSELQGLQDAGWEIGSHTCSHPHLTQIDHHALADELERSKAVCESRLARTCTSLAYPYGDVDGRVVAAAARAGYRAAAGLPEGLLGPRDPHSWPRIGIYHLDGHRRFRLKISPAVRRLRSSSVARLPERLRHTGERLP